MNNPKEAWIIERSEKSDRCDKVKHLKQQQQASEDNSCILLQDFA